MTSTTLKHKNYFSVAFNKVLRKNLGLLIAIIALSVIVPVMSLITSVESAASSTESTQDLTLTLLLTVGIVCIFNGFFSLFLAVRMFNEIYSKRACDTYFAVPLKRSVQYNANFLFGIVANIVSFVISICIFYFGANLLTNSKVTYLITVDGSLIASIIGIVFALLAMYSSFILCAVISGKKSHYVIFAIISMFCSADVISGFFSIINSLWGMTADSTVLSSINPISNALTSALSTGSTVIAFIVISAAEIIGMYIAGYIIFKKRKAEVAEVEFSGKIIPYIFIASLICAAYMLSRLYSSSVVIIILLGIAIAFVVAVILSAILYKKPFNKSVIITFASVCVICTLSIVLVNSSVFDSYVYKVPDADEIESVDISELSVDDNSVSSLYSNLLYSYSTYSSELSVDKITVKSDEGIEKVISLHERLIDDKTIKASSEYNTDTLSYLVDDDYEEYSWCDIALTYHLENGKTIKRGYTVPINYIVTEVADAMRSQEVLSQLDFFDMSNKYDYLFAEVNTYTQSFYDGNENGEDTYSEQELKITDYNEFSSCYMNDILKYDDKRFLSDFGNLSYYFLGNLINYYYYYDNTSTTEKAEVASITFYQLADNTPDDIREKLSSMSYDEFMKYYYYYDGNLSDEQYDQIFEDLQYVNQTYIGLYGDSSETLEYLYSTGLDKSKFHTDLTVSSDYYLDY
ncbi:MAG: hypothetical protein LIO62_00715 [Clostridiales bacterium]|nr:hypothetical protein [Clostridiales bacterium]